MAYPVLFLTIALASGIAAAEALALSPLPVLTGLGVSLVFSVFFFRRNKTTASFIVLLAAAAFLGAGVFAVWNDGYERNALRSLPSGEYFDFVGTVVRSPSPGLDRDDLYLRIQAVSISGTERPMSGRMRIAVARSEQGGRLPDLLVGDLLRVPAQITPPSEYRNFAEPFAPRYLKNRNLHVLGSTKSPLLVERIGRGRTLPPLRWISRIRRACLRRIEQAFASPASPGGLSPEGAVFEALVLGERARMDPETTLALQKSGLYHLFAISGAHIALVSALLFFIFRRIRIPEHPAYAVILVFLVLYGFLVEGRASVVRAVVMASAFIIGKLLWKDVHLLNTISLAALAILYLRPGQMFDAGFQLTFAATLGLILFFPAIRAALPRLPLKIADVFALSVAAQASVAPIVALAFHRVAFSGIFLNLIGIPLVTAVMAAGYLFLPAVFLFPFLAEPAAAGLAFLLRVFLSSTRLLDGLPFLSYRVPSPPGAVAAAYYGFLLLLLVPRRNRLRRVAAVGFTAAFALLATHPFAPSVRDLTVTILDVGQGEAVLVEFPGTSKMLVDGGGLPTGSFDIGENVVSPFLWRKGIKRIDRLVLTHPHPDHMNGLTAVGRNFRIGEFWEGIPAPDDPRYAALQIALPKTAARRRIGRGFRQTVGGVEIEVLSPPSEGGGRTAPDNDSSLVLRLTYGTAAVLLTGDIGRGIEEEILAAGLEVRSQVLKAAHHGSASSSSEAFLTAVRPDFIVVSAGGEARSRLPHPDALARFAGTRARVLRTDRDGAVEFRSDGERIFVRVSRRRP